MRFFRTICIACLLSLTGLLHAQHGAASYPKVRSSQGNPYLYPWAGGMNSCQFGTLDLDLDGTDDLVAFDRVGDRIMPFRAGTFPPYIYAPEYASHFPDIYHWMILADYDGDGKNDIFTYSPGYAGIKVYRNVSSGQLEFRLEVAPYLKSFYGSGYVNILVTYADYPAIVDLDGDGDLDILTFWGLGSFVEMHKNLSMEKYGHADSLDYERTEVCWGYFAESEESNVITLDTCLGWEGRGGELSSANRHTGSTFLVTDLNGDGVKDLLLGDVDYPNFIQLMNGGTSDSAHMISQDPDFPAYNQPVRVFSMPVGNYVDLDFDGLKDLVVSPFDPNPYVTQNFNSIWYYHNSGENDAPVFSRFNTAFLQDEMLDFGSGAFPVMADYDGDGLDDIFVGNYGYYDSSYMDQNLILHSEYTGKIAVLQNTGTPGNPSYNLVERDFAGVSQLERTGIKPAFIDMDGDGDLDMFVGNDLGTLRFYRNHAGPGNQMDMVLEDKDYGITDVGSYSTPVFFDVDEDGRTDLIQGEMGGNLNYFQNIGTQEHPQFLFVTDSLGKVNVTDPSVSLDGYSVPSFYEDPEGKIWLLVGSEQGKLFLYDNIKGNVGGAWNESDQLGVLTGISGLNTDRGFRTSGILRDLSDDGLPELIAGNFSGGLEYLTVSGAPDVSGLGETEWDDAMALYPVPAKDHFTVKVSDQFTVISLEVRDLLGRLVTGRMGDQGNSLGVEVVGWPAGMYFCNVKAREAGGRIIDLVRKVVVY